METVKRIMMGEIEEGDYIEINLHYFRATAPFNLYGHAAAMRWKAPNAKYSDLAAWLTARNLGMVVEVKNYEVREYTYNDKAEKVYVGDSVPLSAHPVNEVLKHPDVYSFMTDRYTPPPQVFGAILEKWPDAWKFFSTQRYAMLTSLYDAPRFLHHVYEFVTERGQSCTREEIDTFSTHVEQVYARRGIREQIEISGYVTLGRPCVDGNPSVLYTLGLYDSKGGRDLLYIQNTNPDSDTADLFKYVAAELFEGTDLDTINEYLKPHKFSVSIRNLKTYPKYAFEFADDELPVMGVYSLIKQ